MAEDSQTRTLWEMFNDVSYYDLWCVRPVGDKKFGSIQSFHFVQKEDAEQFKILAEKAL